MESGLSSSYVPVGSFEMYVETLGEGPDLVLLHGGASSIAGLADLREQLIGVRRVIAPDQRGHGRTADVGELTYESMADDTARMLDAVGIREADVVGHSDGGILALLLGLSRPDLVRRIVPISANVSNVGAPSWISEADAAWLATATSADLPAPPPDPEVPHRSETWPATANRILDMWRGGLSLTLEGLAALSRPVLFVSGDRDLVSLDHTLAMFRAVSDAQLAVVPGADHSVPQTHVRQVAGVIRDFLDPPAP